MAATQGFKNSAENVHPTLGTSQRGYRDRRTVWYLSRLLFNLSGSSSRRSVPADTETKL